MRRLSGVVQGAGGGYVREVCALEMDAGGEALGCEVGEVDGCVYADGGEGGSVIETFTVLGGQDVELRCAISVIVSFWTLGERAYVGDCVFPPWGGLEEGVSRVVFVDVYGGI